MASNFQEYVCAALFLLKCRPMAISILNKEIGFVQYDIFSTISLGSTLMEVFSFKFNYFYCQMYFLGDFLILVVLLWFSLDVQVIYPFFFIYTKFHVIGFYCLFKLKIHCVTSLALRMICWELDEFFMIMLSTQFD